MYPEISVPSYISTKDLKKYFKEKKLTINTPNGETITITELLTQYNNEETIKSIKTTIKNNIKEEIEIYTQSTEMTTPALAEHITDKLLNNSELFKIYNQLMEESNCQPP